MSIYDKVGIRPSRGGQVFISLCLLAILGIVIWAFIKNGSAAWVMIPITAFGAGLGIWQLRGYSQKKKGT